MPQQNEDVCHDGKMHDGRFCGRGPCNIFGCNCDDGCFDGSRKDVRNIRGETKLAFLCDAHVPAGSMDVRSLVGRSDCSCLKYTGATWDEYVLPEYPVVEGAWQDASDPLYCENHLVYCEVAITKMKSFTVTTSLTVGAGLSHASVPVDFSASVTREWAESTGTDVSYSCTAEGGGGTVLRVKPKYFKVTVVSFVPKVVDGRNRCTIRDVYVPKVNADGTIAGDRKCGFRTL